MGPLAYGNAAVTRILRWFICLSSSVAASGAETETAILADVVLDREYKGVREVRRNVAKSPVSTGRLTLLTPIDLPTILRFGRLRFGVTGGCMAHDGRRND